MLFLWCRRWGRNRRRQSAVCIEHAAQQNYFGVSPRNNCSEVSDHCNALDKLGVEGCKSIRDTAAGSGAGLGHRAVGGGSAGLVEAQPLNASKISAVQSIAHGL